MDFISKNLISYKKDYIILEKKWGDTMIRIDREEYLDFLIKSKDKKIIKNENTKFNIVYAIYCFSITSDNSVKSNIVKIYKKYN